MRRAFRHKRRGSAHVSAGGGPIHTWSRPPCHRRTGCRRCPDGVRGAWSFRPPGPYWSRDFLVARPAPRRYSGRAAGLVHGGRIRVPPPFSPSFSRPFPRPITDVFPSSPFSGPKRPGQCPATPTAAGSTRRGQPATRDQRP